MRVLTYLRFAKGLSVKRLALFCSHVYCIIHACVCVQNVFGVGPESDGEALMDRGSRPWG